MEQQLNTKPSCDKLTVWLVDDDPIVRLIIDHKIKSHYQEVNVIQYSDAKEAYKHLLNDDLKEFPDYIILDEDMPGMQGHELCERIDRELSKKPKVVVNSCDSNLKNGKFRYSFVIGYFEQKGKVAIHDTLFHLGWAPYHVDCA